MFLEQKKCGKIKGRGCADGRKQRATTNNEDASTPTADVESVMKSCAIDAMEQRDVATADIPAAFMHADMDEVVQVRLKGTMAELLTKIDPPQTSGLRCRHQQLDHRSVLGTDPETRLDDPCWRTDNKQQLD